MHVLNLLIKDLKIILKDWKLLAVLILMPIILTTILGFALSNAFYSGDSDMPLHNLKLYIVKEYNKEEEIKDFLLYMKGLNQDVSKKMDSPLLNELNLEYLFFNKFLDNEEITSIVEYEVTSLDEAKQGIEDNQITAYIRLPKGFIYDGLVSFFTPSRNRIEIDLVSNPNSNFYRKIVTEIIKSFTETTNLFIINKGILMETVIKEEGLAGLDKMDHLFNNLTDAIEQRNISYQEFSITGARPIDSFTYTTVGMLAMFMLFSAGIAAKMLLDEKNEKTFQRTLISGVKDRAIFLSKFLLTIVIVTLQAFIMLSYSSLLLGVKWHNTLAIICLVIVAATSIASLGLFLGFVTIISDNYKLVSAFEAVIVQVLALLGGSYIPIEYMPDMFKWISKFTVNGLFLDGVMVVLSGGHLKDTVGNIIGLLAFTLFFFIAAILLMKRKGDRVAL